MNEVVITVVCGTVAFVLGYGAVLEVGEVTGLVTIILLLVFGV